MSGQKDNAQDPDYAVAGPSRQQKIFEEPALINKMKRVNTIIEREFDRSISEKEKEILLINSRLHEAIRILSLLRYAIISEFYNRKECQAGTSSDSKQGRIHPAIKQIIGKSPRNLRHRGSDGLSSKNDSEASTSTSNETQSSVNGILDSSHQDSQNLDWNLNGFGFDHQIPGKSSQNLRVLYKNDQIPVQDHQIPVQNHQIPTRNNQNHQLPASDHQHSGQSHQEPVQSDQNSTQDHQHPGLNSKNHQTPSQISSNSPSNPTLKRKNDQEHLENPSKKLCPNEPEFQRGDGFKETRIVVIGNISTPIPPIDRIDQYTHKWQVYVREKDSDKISEYVSKVVFQLHPSYKPNDVIEVDRAPFNLARRGWGNFSMTVTLVFKNKANLPRAFVHNLTLAHVSETVYALKIFPADYAPPSFEPEESSESEEEEVDVNGDDGDSNALITLKKKEVMANIYLEHRYVNLFSIGEANRTINHSGIKSMKDIGSRRDSARGSRPGNGDLGGLRSDKTSKIGKTNLCEAANGDKESLLISKAICQPLEIKIPDINETIASSVKQVLVFNDKQIPLSFNKERKKVNGNGISILKKNVNGKNGINISINPAKSLLLNVPDSEPALKIVTEKRAKLAERRKKHINYHVRLKEALVGFKEEDVEKIVRFLAKRLPIVTPEACDWEFKSSFPYVCRTVEEFLGFNIGKQRSAEWYRAKEIRNFMKLKVREEEIWTVKEILLWCRFQGFTPVRALSWGSEKGEKEEINTCTEARELVDWVRKMKSSGEEKEDVEIIDVEGDDFCPKEVQEKKGEFFRLEMTEEETKMNYFVTETARQVGVTLGDEEIEEGVRDDAAGRVVVKAVECLLEDLLRSSLSKTWERNSYKCQDVITVNDLRKAISEREEFDVFTNSGLGTTQ